MSQERFSTGEYKVIAAVFAISFLQGLQFGVSPILGEIAKHYSSVNVSLVQMLITAPAIMAIPIALLSGVLVTKVRKKTLLLFAAVLAAVVGFLPFLADSFALLFFSRCVYGVSLGLAMSLNAVVVADFFEGAKRVKAMGIQAASVGLGMVVVTSIGGFLGRNGFRNAYWINLIAVACLAVLMIFLPDQDLVKAEGKGPAKLSKQVWLVALFAFLEFLFLITFSTNIAMHMKGALEGSTQAAGTVTGVFSAIQIIAGFILGNVTKRTGKFTLPFGMFLFVPGAVLLLLFPGNLAMLLLGAVFCGFSQGFFVPTSFVEAANASAPEATAMASAIVTSANCIGQLLSPVLLNTMAGSILGATTTDNVYKQAAVGMLIASILCAMWKKS